MHAALRSADVETPELAAARAGDHAAFDALTRPYARELHVHCYRMLGSFQDAEDAVQETLLRAWRHLDTFQGRSPFRAWLYRIATNVCLKQRTKRKAPHVQLPQLVEAIAASTEPALYLSPYPDALLDELGDPEGQYDLRESVQLALLAAVQLLPPRQRAALILRDVAGFSAAEVAEFLDSTVASVNSALNRARLTLQQQREAGRLQLRRAVPSNAAAQLLVRRYIDAWQSANVARLAGLLRQDVAMTMPPLPLRYTGRDAVTQFLTTAPPAMQRERFRFVPTRANRQPALAVYRQDVETFRAWGVFVFTVDGEDIAEITAFINTTLPKTFGLPAEWSSALEDAIESP